MKFVHHYHVKCDGTRACEKICSKTFFKNEDASFSAIKVEPKGGKFEINVCNQCGACIDVCPVGAIKRNKAGIVAIDKKSCVGCFVCVGFCPTKSMRRADGQREPFKCVSCGACVKACPNKALVMAEAECTTECAV
ncbi:MAG: 4Fe-4S binding protein [Candidatus Riflebacteria bacterium]|nr:4Fe-4S binding protein [Candidatus Riflebacteria bacterium]